MMLLVYNNEKGATTMFDRIGSYLIIYMFLSFLFNITYIRITIKSSVDKFKELGKTIKPPVGVPPGMIRPTRSPPPPPKRYVKP
jgi:hypothetical protein